MRRGNHALDSEIPSLVRTVPRALRVRLAERRAHSRPDEPGRILVAPHLRLGDAILVTPLLSKLRERHPASEIVVLSTIPMLPLYASRPYGVLAWPYHPRRFETVAAMLRQDGFDLAILPGDNRHAWLAAALRSRWIVAHAGDRPWVKSWPVDELVEYPEVPTATAEIFSALAPGPEPRAFRPGDWPKPACAPFPLPDRPYAVLHVGASTRLKHWPEQNWRGLAAWLGGRGLDVVWSGGAGDEALVRAIDPEGRHQSHAGRLDLAQLWHLMAGARLFVSPDTGVAHLARLAGVPSVTLFGPGSPLLFGRGRFWRDAPCAEVVVEDMPCRDQDDLFNRRRPWIRRCGRAPRQCRHGARCMTRLGAGEVEAAIESVGA